MVKPPNDYAAILCTFRPGGEYTLTDIANRLNDRGWPMSETRIKRVIRKLALAHIIRGQKVAENGEFYGYSLERMP